MTEGFCVRCRKIVEMKNEKTIKYRNGRIAKQGICPECGGKVNKIIPKKKGIIETLFPPLPKASKSDEEES